jgi:hypothetical protein
MGWSDIAAQALQKACETWEKVVELTVKVDGLVQHVVFLREDQRCQQRAFEDRLERRHADEVARVERRQAEEVERAERRIDALERRIRELEERQASLQGKVSGALTEAFRRAWLERGAEVAASLTGMSSERADKTESA